MIMAVVLVWLGLIAFAAISVLRMSLGWRSAARCKGCAHINVFAVECGVRLCPGCGEERPHEWVTVRALGPWGWQVKEPAEKGQQH